MKVKTKEWGSKYDHLKKHIGNLASSLEQHNRELDNEVSLVAAGGHQHAYARHGWQTGWEQQLIRAVTTVTPDQAFDPYGVAPSIRCWNQIFVASATSIQIGKKAYDNKGRTTNTITGAPFDPLPTNYNHPKFGTGGTMAPKKGAISGHFISPMAQQEAKRLTGIKMPFYTKWDKGDRKKGGGTQICDVSRIVMVTGPASGGKILGLGFNGSKCTPRSRQEVVFLIKAFQGRMNVKDVMNNCPHSSAKSRSQLRDYLVKIHKASDYNAVKSLNPVAFDNTCDLISALEVEIVANRRVLSVWDRVPGSSPTQWKLVTSYATSDTQEECEFSIYKPPGAGKVTGDLFDCSYGSGFSVYRKFNVVKGKVIVPG